LFLRHITADQIVSGGVTQSLTEHPMRVTDGTSGDVSAQRGVPCLNVPRRQSIAQASTIIAAIRAQAGRPPACVVLDTLNRSLAGSESNDKDMALYIRAADAIREAFKCAVIIVHHCGVEGTRPRGHTSLTGAVDAQLAVKRDATENVIVTVEWMKDGAEGDVIASRLERVEIGTDADGDVVSSCVVVPAEASESTRRPSGTSRLTKAAQTALRALVEAIDEQGMAAPASNHIPASARIVTLNIWRQQAYRRGISTSEEDRAKQQAFKRASEYLIGAGRVGVWDDQVWLTS
jgi:AAA domain